MIKALSDGPESTSGARAFVPYRNSALTWLLKESLGGNARTFMIACISPSDASYQETVGTLNYVARARKIRCAPKINEAVDSEDELVRQLRMQIKRLENELESARREDVMTETDSLSSSAMSSPSSSSSSSSSSTSQSNQSGGEDELHEPNMDELYAAQLQTQKRAALQSLKRRRYRRVEENANANGSGKGVGSVTGKRSEALVPSADEGVPLYEVLSKEIKFWKQRLDERESEMGSEVLRTQKEASLVTSRCQELEQMLSSLRETSEKAQGLASLREAGLERQVQEKVSELVQEKARVAELERVQEGLQRELAEAGTAHQESRAQANGLNSALQDAEAARVEVEESKRRERAELESKLGTAAHALEVAQANHAEIESQLGAATTELESARTKEYRVTVELEDSRAREAALRDELESERASRATQLVESRVAHLAALDEAAKQASDALGAKDCLAQEFEEYKSRTGSELGELREKVGRQGLEVETLQREAAARRHDLKEVGVLNKKLKAETEREVDALKELNRTLVAERTESEQAVQIQIAKVQELEDQVARQTAAVEAGNQDLATARAHHHTLKLESEKRARKLDSFSALNETLKREIEGMESLNEALKAEVRKRTEEIERLSKELKAESRRRIAEVEALMKKFKAEADKREQEMRGRVEAAERERDEQAAEATMLQDRLSSVYKEFASLRFDLKAAAKEKKKMQRAKAKEDKENGKRSKTVADSDGSGQVEALRLRASKAEQNCQEATLKLAEVTVELENRMENGNGGSEVDKLRLLLQNERKSFQSKMKDLKRQLRQHKGANGQGQHVEMR